MTSIVADKFLSPRARADRARRAAEPRGGRGRSWWQRSSALDRHAGRPQCMTTDREGRQR